MIFLVNKINPKNWNEIQETCIKALSLFPNSFYGGIDLLIYPNFKEYAIEPIWYLF
ncbi:hypothetical protein [Geminocystis sp. GBBB08]|uniref:hypothetical protein n=1 Tax=Geminocystis sp. GBBB08 TaxID=2604140 RepID=UPI0027E27324|nr:hypothetical protein [Geminocystis sp. GBBB08]